jgi:hypothetical protein
MGAASAIDPKVKAARIAYLERRVAEMDGMQESPIMNVHPVWGYKRDAIAEMHCTATHFVVDDKVVRVCHERNRQLVSFSYAEILESA